MDLVSYPWFFLVALIGALCLLTKRWATVALQILLDCLSHHPTPLAGVRDAEGRSWGSSFPPPQLPESLIQHGLWHLCESPNQFDQDLVSCLGRGIISCSISGNIISWATLALLSVTKLSSPV